MKLKKAGKLATLAAVAALALTGCSSYDPSVDKRALEIEDYLVIKTDRDLVGCHEPGKSGYGGVGNEIVEYPAGQRTYSFTGANGSEAAPMQVVSNENVAVNVPGYITFTLTDDCENLYDFHKKVGVKFKAHEDEGWRKLLDTYFGVAVSASLNDAAGNLPWQSIYSSSSVRKDMEKALTDTLEERISTALGGDWIKVNKVSLSKPDVDGDLKSSIQAAETAKLDNKAQAQRNTVAATKYDSLVTCERKGLSENACVTLHLAEEGSVELLPVPVDGGSIIVNKGGN